jgi:6-phosphofructokinase 1
MEMVDKLRDTSQSHDRCTVVEVMGRNAGFIAVNTGIACGAIEIITKELPYDLDAIAKKMLEAKANGKQNFVIVVAEGIGNATEIAKIIEEKTHIESRATILGHVQRGGIPTVRDRVLATELAYHAVGLLEQGLSNRVVGIRNDQIVDFDIQEALSMEKPYEYELHKIAEEIAI